MDADGSDIVDLTNSPETLENWPSWGPAPAQPRPGLNRLGAFETTASVDMTFE